MTTQTSPQSLDAAIDSVMRPVADAASEFIFFAIELFGVEVPLIVLWLIAGGLFFTFYLRFINFRGFRHAIDIVRGKYVNHDDPGQITQFQALSTAVSGTVGIGNIAGVAVAISVGGPGATFWLIVAGLLGMSTKLAECTLGLVTTASTYRRASLEPRKIDSGSTLTSPTPLMRAMASSTLMVR